ncbi:NHS-like protein 3 [Pempheris klunzingeri]|uniref:NHS-like protein 3 n=1 Tax=Pempheris klunzingeri TaxID=3127111 RepID=UPI00397EC135
MSNRDSLGFGDLLPQDVVDIFAQEKHYKRKKRSHSLGRALGWLKGKKRKDLGTKRERLGLGPALDLALDGHPAGNHGGHKGGQKSGKQAHPQAVPKRDDDDKTLAPPLFQENVFIEASRPKYLENLHTEAQEGLKMMQQEETNNGVEHQDNESTISTMTVHTDGESGGFMTDSTIADTTSIVSVQSSVSTRSSRSGLTRQESTFRPLNSGKKSDKTKTRRRHRKTVVGIPHHVQRELGLDRVDWTLAQRLDEEQLYNGETDNSPTTDGPQQAAKSQKGASASHQDVNIAQPLNKDQLKQLDATHAGHRDDMALLHRLGPDLSGELRPRSLAVPWMTTANSLQQEPPSPVMSMSPQAAYMSKIIPNAVLPPSIEVVEISRGPSRNSVRTVSKSSLVLSSPAPSRASSRASTITSASRQRPPNLSDSSGWSNSESSETLVSDSSTISSSSTPRQKKSQDGDASAREDKISVHSSRSKSSKCTSNGKLIIKGDKEGPFQRSLSVMKPKRAPPPPNRSYSLHNKMKRRSRDLAEVKVIEGESSLHSSSASGHKNEKNKSGSSPMMSMIIDNHGYNADTSSLDDSTGSVSFSPIRSQLKTLKAEETAKVEETVCRGASQEKQREQKSPQENKPSKIISPSSGYSSQDGRSPQTSKQPHNSSPRHKKGILAKLQRLFPGSTTAENLKPDTSVDTVSVSPSVRTLRDLFNIPPPPKVHAPPPPPPEVWAHSKRTFELLLGPPAPDNVYAIIKKNPKDRRQQRQSPSASTEGSAKSLAVERKHKNPTVTVEPANGSLHVLETKTVQESGFLNVGIDKENNGSLAEQNVDLKGNSKVTEKDEKVRVSDILDRMLVKAVEKGEGRLAEVTEEKARKSTSQASEVKNDMETLPAISLARIPPSPSPPHHPPTSVQVVSPESSWPPPPPPVGQGGLTDEIDFPLPPPPMFGEEGLVSPVQVPPKSATPDGDSCTTTSVISVVKTERLRVTTEVELQKPSASQGVVPPPLSIPPPPPYTAPPPPVKIVSPPTTKMVSPSPPKEVSHSPPPTEDPSPPPKEVSPPPPKEILLPPPKEILPPPPKEVSPPPPKEILVPPPKEILVPPPKEASPPPPKEASPPPPKEASPPPPKEASPPPPKEVSPPPPKEVSPPPPKEVSPPPPKEILLPPHKEILLPPPKEIPPPPPKEASPPPPKEASPPPPKEVSPPPPKEVSPPPPKEILLPPHKEILLPPPKEIPPPPPKEASPPPPKEVSPPPPKEVSPPPPKEILLPPPKEIPPPPPKEASPPPPKEASPPPPKDASPPPPKEVPAVKPTDSSPPLVQEAPSPLDVSPTLVTVVTPSPLKEVSPLPPIEVSTLSTEEVSPPSFQQNTCQSSEDVTPITKLAPPQSFPPPPPLQSQPQSSEQEINPPQENIQYPETVSILTPPQSIPPPPPIQLLFQPQVVPPNTEDPVTQEASSPPPSEASIPTALENSPSPEKVQELAPPPPVNIPVPPPLPEQGHASIKHQPSPASTENQTLELTSAPVAQEEPTLIVTPSILQTVKLRSVSSSPEPPKDQEEPESEVTVRNQQPSNQVPTTSASSEAPQKPIRRSLIITSPTSISPPATLTSQPALPKSQFVVVPPATSSKTLSPTRKSPPAMTAAPSMNLQEAIRLRTAARSQGSTASRLSLNVPTSPLDPHKSPSSTASFIFSKSNRKVVIETKTTVQKNLEVSSVAKVVSDAESVKKGVKVPPPVAKKPKTKSKEVETREGTEQRGGQEALQECIKDAAEKTNGTASAVEGGRTPST